MLWLSLAILLSSPPAEDLVSVRQLLENGHFQEAERQLDRYIQENPNEARAHYLRGVLNSAQQRLDVAENALLRAVELNPADPDPYLLLGRMYRSQQKLKKSIELLQRGLETTSQSPQVSFELARSLAEARQFAAALKRLESVSPEQAPDRYWELAGSCHLMLGATEAAEKAFQSHLDGHPRSVKTLQTLAAIALQQDQIDRAWDYIARARRLAPTSPQILFDFAHVSFTRNLVSEAVTALRFLLIMEPDRPEYLFQLASAMIRLADYTKAQQLLDRYVQLRPDDARGRAMLGYAYFSGNRYPEAKEHLLRAVELDPSELEALYYLGTLAYTQGEDEKAERYFKEILLEDNTHGRAHLGLGKLRLRQRRFEEALESLRHAEEQRPDDFDVYFQLSRVYSSLGQRELASQAMQKYSELKAAQDQADAEALRLPYSAPGESATGR